MQAFLTVFVCVIVLGDCFEIGKNAYCNFKCGEEHTICKRAPCPGMRKCGRNFRKLVFHDEDRDYVVKIHNKFRQLIAQGEIKKDKSPPKLVNNVDEEEENDYAEDSSSTNSAVVKKSDGGNGKESDSKFVRIRNAREARDNFSHLGESSKIQASNMRIMSYNKELEFVAQCWANTCPQNYLHDTCRSIKNYEKVGQSVWLYNYLPENYSDMWILHEIFVEWRNNIDLITPQLVTNFHDSQEYAKTTRAIWAKTHLVGCGRARFGKANTKMYVVVCNYATEGNLMNKKIFSEGKPCSRCPKNVTCNKEYKALCGETTNYKLEPFDSPFFMGSKTGHLCRCFLFVLVLYALPLVF